MARCVTIRLDQHWPWSGEPGGNERYSMRFLFGLAAVLTLVLAEPAQSQDFKNGVVVTVSAPASDVGVEIMKQGGNAVDAAVATAFALAVTHPAAGNIGGGGFMVIHSPEAEPLVIEYRETAPAT